MSLRDDPANLMDSGHHQTHHTYIWPNNAAFSSLGSAADANFSSPSHAESAPPNLPEDTFDVDAQYEREHDDETGSECVICEKIIGDDCVCG
jgi:hypothetical protein